ncbi:MAG TPA: SDR family NAD(P)-dependent oxidoreductase [Dehalococcoidia bacterium]|nr:SDR family NAD(P)-dependent oxidoreductase [Dehalococcoidia bacterium]
MAKPLEGKTALVTGSSRGIGKVIALQLAGDGANVVVCARSVTAGELPGTIGETAKEVELAGGHAIAVKLDLADDADIDNSLEQARKAFGGLDILVNNAVIVGPRRRFVGGESEFLDHAYRVNVRGPYVLAQKASAMMAQNGGGAIINISSGAARNSQPPTKPATDAELDSMDPSYGITKAALDRISTAYASELMGKNISIMSISPGLVITERIRQAAIRPNVDFSRAEPADVIARAVSFLALNGMQYTGRVLSAKDVVAENNL